MSPIDPELELALLQQAAVLAGEAFGPCFDLDEAAMPDNPFDAAADMMRFAAVPDEAGAPAGIAP